MWPRPSRPPRHVRVLVESRYRTQAEPAGAIDSLRAAGHTVEILDPEHHVLDLVAPRDAHVDLVLARGRSSALLSLLRAAEVAGVPVVNSAAAVESVVDKAGMGAVLAAAGVPVPRTWVGPVDALASRSDLEFPLVLKPVRGDNARGLVVVHSRAQLAAVTWPEPVALAQAFHRGDGTDLKLYVAGERVWAVRRPSPVAADGSVRPVATVGEAVAVPPALEDVARRCGRAFGLRLFGVDCVEGEQGPLVVEVNDYPTYRGAPGASEAIVDLVEDLCPAAAVAA